MLSPARPRWLEEIEKPDIEMIKGMVTVLCSLPSDNGDELHISLSFDVCNTSHYWDLLYILLTVRPPLALYTTYYNVLYKTMYRLKYIKPVHDCLLLTRECCWYVFVYTALTTKVLIT